MNNNRHPKGLYIGILLILMLFAFFMIPLKGFINSGKKVAFNHSINPDTDTDPPIIAFLQTYPSKPEWFDDVNITVEVYDANSGIKKVILSYNSKLDEYGGYRNFTMKHLKDDVFSHVIPNSIYVQNNGFGDNVTYKVYACDQNDNWVVSDLEFYYMNDTIKPNSFLYTPNNYSFLPALAKFNVSSSDNGSGICCVNLTIYNQSGYKIESFASNNPSNIFEWDTSSLPDYNASNPLYYIVNYTVNDKSTPQNSNITTLFVYIDKESPYVSYINRIPCQDNNTITDETVKGLIDLNSQISDSYFNDSQKYLKIINDTDGTIKMPLSVNLSDFGIEFDLIDSINISLSAKINYSNNNIIQAGWGVYNWTNNTITEIDGLIFNQTNDIFENLIINKSDISDLISEGNNSRIELFMLFNTTGPTASFMINYLNFHIIYDNEKWFYGNNFSISVWCNDTIGIERIDIHHENITLFEINSSLLGPASIDTSLLSDGEAVKINLTAYDKAGNILIDILTIKNDDSGPNVNITSPPVNSTFGESGIWNTIVPITVYGNETISEFEKMELYVDGVLQTVTDEQIDQIIETNATGHIIYVQTNSTWYKEGTYTYYWNASQCQENKTYNLTLVGYDILNNTNSYELNLTKSIFTENISIETEKLNGLIETISFTLEVTIKNNGNSTLLNYTPTLIIPNSWTYTLQGYSSNDFQYLNPNAQKTITFLITPSEVSKTKNYNITIKINCQIVENLSQPTNNLTVSKQITLIISEKPLYMDLEKLIPLLLSVFIGLGLGLLIILIYYRVKIKGEKPKLKSK